MHIEMLQRFLLLLLVSTHVYADEEPFSIGLGVLAPSYVQTVGKDDNKIKVDFQHKDDGFSYAIGDLQSGTNSYFSLGSSANIAASHPESAKDLMEPEFLKKLQGGPPLAYQPVDAPPMIHPPPPPPVHQPAPLIHPPPPPQIHQPVPLVHQPSPPVHQPAPLIHRPPIYQPAPLMRQPDYFAPQPGPVPFAPLPPGPQPLYHNHLPPQPMPFQLQPMPKAAGFVPFHNSMQPIPFKDSPPPLQYQPPPPQAFQMEHSQPMADSSVFMYNTMNGHGFSTKGFGPLTLIGPSVQGAGNIGAAQQSFMGASAPVTGYPQFSPIPAQSFSQNIAAPSTNGFRQHGGHSNEDFKAY